MAIVVPAPNHAGRQIAMEVKEGFVVLERMLVASVPGSGGARELALARTNLEVASMWATKAVCLAFPGGT